MFNWVKIGFNWVRASILFSVGFPGSDVSLGSQCGCHLRFFSKLCMRVVDKNVNYAVLLCCREL